MHTTPAEPQDRAGALHIWTWAGLVGLLSFLTWIVATIWLGSSAVVVYPWLIVLIVALGSYGHTGPPAWWIRYINQRRQPDAEGRTEVDAP